jgi:hypothetical protein
MTHRSIKRKVKKHNSLSKHGSGMHVPHHSRACECAKRDECVCSCGGKYHQIAKK